MRTFKLYCQDIACDPRSCEEVVILNFLSILKCHIGLKYRTICGYRSAIAKYHNTFSGSSKQVKQLVKACYLDDPPLPRYTDIWDVNILLEYLETLYPHDTLSDIDLSIKTAALLSIHSVSRSDKNC